MTSAWFLGLAHSVPQDESVVRSTIDGVRSDGELAEMEAAPEWNEKDSDDSGELTGIKNRIAGSATFDSTESNVPALLDLASANRNSVIDNQVASSGTAAKREAAGQAGHGTMQYAIGIDPLNPAQTYGNDYFVAGALSANEGSGAYMNPVSTDNWAQAVAQASATDRARNAYQSSLYNSFMGE